MGCTFAKHGASNAGPSSATPSVETVGESIRGGCGNPFHIQHHRPSNGRAANIFCKDCSRQVLTAGVGYYFCNLCEGSSCMRCTSAKQGHPGSSDSRGYPVPPIPSSDEDPQEEEEEVVEPVLPCAGSLIHSLEFLQESPYGHKGFGCDMCKEGGSGALYHCESCQFDAHPQCAEVEEDVKVFYHEHLLQRYYLDPDEEESIMCQCCQGDVEENVSPWVYKCPFCPDYAVHARCAKYARSMMHSSHPHKLTLVHKSSDPRSRYLSRNCDGCGSEINHNVLYTCTKRGCDFDLHPLCTLRPPMPTCKRDPSHRVNLDYFPQEYEPCDLCDTPSDDVWVYRCNDCNLIMHVDCFSFAPEEFSSDDEDDEDDGNFDLYQKFLESMDEFGNQGNDEKVDRLSELVNRRLIESTSEAAAASSLARQSSVKSRAQRKVSSLAPSETHILDRQFSSMNFDGDSPPRPQYDESPSVSSRERDAEEADRRKVKQADKEERRKAKAASKELHDREKAVRRKAKAEYQQKVDAGFQKLASDLKSIKDSKQFGRTSDAEILQQIAELKAKTEDRQRADAERHQEQAKLTGERHHEHMRKFQEQSKVQGERHQETTNMLQYHHQEYLNMLQEIIRTQVQSTTRAVPRLVLCTETASFKKKILTSLRLGIKCVQLHLLCEHADQPHVVAGSPGCEINQKVAGNRWEDKIKPFLAAGLKVLGLALTVGGAAAGGMVNLRDVIPDLYTMVTKTHVIELGRHAVQRNQGPSDQKAEVDAAEQWLVSYLKVQQVDIADAFRLYRVRYIYPKEIKGTIGWLCDKHRTQGRKNGSLELFPDC